MVVLRSMAPHCSAMPSPAQAPTQSAQGVVQGDAGEHHRTDPVVVQERAEALLAIARARDHEFVRDQHSGHAERAPVVHPEPGALADQRQRAQEQCVQHAQRDQVEFAEQDRGRLGAGAQVVVAVDHRVPGVVGGRPEDVGDVQHPRDRRHFAAQRRRTPSGCPSRRPGRGTPAAARCSASGTDNWRPAARRPRSARS